MILDDVLSRLLAPAVLCAAVLSACGSGDGGGRAGRTAPESPTPRSPLDLPRGVPLRSSGAAADPGRTRVIRAWLGALRDGDVAAASALWAVPSRVQNGSPLFELRSRRAVALFNDSLPCGAVLTRAGGAQRGFTIATMRLTDRKGGRCGSGVGAGARTAIRVRDGRIVEWYRLPGDPRDPGSPAPAPGGGEPIV